MYAVTYTTDVAQLTINGLAVADSGVYPKLIKRVSVDEDSDGRIDHIALMMTKVDTAYGEPVNGKVPSLCLIKLNHRDIYRDTEAEGYDPDYVPFCEAVGLDVLAYGEDTYQQIFDDPVKLTKWRTVLPDVEILDIDGIGTGQFEIQRWTEFDAPKRN